MTAAGRAAAALLALFALGPGGVVAAGVDAIGRAGGYGAAAAQTHRPAPPPGADSAAGDATAPPRVLDVPYMPQTEALCGGAAAAMVMRYWGEGAVRPEGFSHLVDGSAGGIRSDRLVAELDERGWRPHAFRGRLEDLRRHVERGRPVTVLIEVSPDRYHYVVVVAVPEDEVLLHDPARAPFQLLDREEFRERWSAADRWTLLLMPPEGAAGGDGVAEAPAADPPEAPAAPSDPSARARPDPGGEPTSSAPADVREAGAPGEGGECAAEVRAAVRRATSGDEAAAVSLLQRAARRCPSSAAPHRELAGLRFRQQRWSEASARARDALAAAPADSQAAHLLAASRYMRDEETAALSAWNRVGRPRVASLRAYGLKRSRWETVAPRLGVSEGDLLTPEALALARRRAASVPSFARTRVRYRPRADGRADLQVAAVERPLVFGSPLEAVVTGLASLPQRELRLTAAGLARASETWEAGWRWWEDRPAVWLEAAFPRAFGADGRWTVRGGWEREAFGGDGAGAGLREERAGAGLSFSRWATGSLRWEAGLALDRWEERQAYVRPSAALELRSGGDRAAVRGEAAAWAGLDDGEAFPRGTLEAAWTPVRADGTGGTLALRGGAVAVAAEAPLSLRPGAGTGDARRHLLRAHPLLDDGVVTGAGFGRALAHGSVEARGWLVRVGPVRVGVGGFVDAARAWDRPAALGPAPDGGSSVAAGDPVRDAPGLLLDAGGGLRLAPGADAGHLRVDVAGGLLDEAGAVSVGWRAPWPGW